MYTIHTSSNLLPHFAFLTLFHGAGNSSTAVLILSTRWQHYNNIMAATAMQVSEDPPDLQLQATKICAGKYLKSNLSLQQIHANCCFCTNIYAIYYSIVVF